MKQVFRTPRSPWIPVIGALLLAGVVFMIVASAPTPTPSTDVQLRDVTPQRLAKNGIHLLVPSSGDHAVVPMAAAEHTASLRGHPGVPAQVRETVLARVTVDGRMEGLAWVVSLDPSAATVHGPAGGTPPTVRWYVVFIDASTGQWLGSDAGD